MTIDATLLTVRDTLRAQLAEILYCEPTEIGDNTVFQDIGLDSVLSVELIASVNAIYGLQEKAQTVRDNGTLNQLAYHITTKVIPDTNGIAT